MIRSIRLTCILDTNVIYPIEIRDLLFWFAYSDLFIPKWSKHIFDEWEIVMRRIGVAEDEISKRMNKATFAFPDAFVENYEPFIELLNLPDPKDCHVLAAAIKADADIIVTNNLKDFPKDYLAKFEVSVSYPQKVTEQYLLDIEREAFLSLVTEPKTIERISHMLSTNKPLRN